MSKWYQYYKCIKLVGQYRCDYWHTKDPAKILECYDLVLPLGRNKPKNIEEKEIMQG